MGEPLQVNYNSATAIMALLQGQGLGMRKKFGQNFLVNPALRAALVDALGAEAGEEVWEIGPGLGSMTRLLLDRGLAVRAFEVDAGFLRLLGQIFPDEVALTLVPGDVLKTWPTQPAAPFLLGNLPYNIGSVLLAELVRSGRVFRRMVITVQREVALRMYAPVGGPDYSAFSVLCAAAYRASPLMTIKGSAFYPKPNVDSQGVLLERRDDGFLEGLPACFHSIVRASFASRRKTLRNNLTAFVAGLVSRPESADMTGELLLRCSIDGRLRAENLGPADFASLAKAAVDMGICR